MVRQKGKLLYYTDSCRTRDARKTGCVCGHRAEKRKRHVHRIIYVPISSIINQGGGCVVQKERSRIQFMSQNEVKKRRIEIADPDGREKNKIGFIVTDLINSRTV